MEAFLQYLENPESGALAEVNLRQIVVEYPWFVTGRIALSRATGVFDPALRLRFMIGSIPAFLLQEPQYPIPEERPARDVIDRFLEKKNLRVRVKEDTPVDDISVGSVTEDPDLVSEELAEIYMNQGLKSKAKDIYVKLSLLYPKKSVYFAEIIHRIDNPV